MQQITTTLITYVTIYKIISQSPTLLNINTWRWAPIQSGLGNSCIRLQSYWLPFFHHPSLDVDRILRVLFWWLHQRLCVGYQRRGISDPYDPWAAEYRKKHCIHMRTDKEYWICQYFDERMARERYMSHNMKKVINVNGCWHIRDNLSNISVKETGCYRRNALFHCWVPSTHDLTKNKERKPDRLSDIVVSKKSAYIT